MDEEGILSPRPGIKGLQEAGFPALSAGKIWAMLRPLQTFAWAAGHTGFVRGRMCFPRGRCTMSKEGFS